MRSANFNITTGNEDLPPGKSEALIGEVPDGILVDIGKDEPVINVRALMGYIRRITFATVMTNALPLRSATWVVTDEASLIEELGMHGQSDCVTCRHGTDLALAALRQNGKPMLVCSLTWAARSSDPT